MIKSLKIGELYNKCDDSSLKFKTTSSLKHQNGIIGQQRALSAINTALGINYEGYNLFVMGNSGTGRHQLVKKLILEKSKKNNTSHDWCYVNNFDDFNKPISIKLPAGLGLEFKNDMDTLIETLQTEIPMIFSSQQYLTKKNHVENTLKSIQDKEFFKVKEELVLELILV